jgi:hypothetical protein
VLLEVLVPATGLRSWHVQLIEHVAGRGDTGVGTRLVVAPRPPGLDDLERLFAVTGRLAGTPRTMSRLAAPTSLERWPVHGRDADLTLAIWSASTGRGPRRCGSCDSTVLRGATPSSARCWRVGSRR